MLQSHSSTTPLVEDLTELLEKAKELLDSSFAELLEEETVLLDTGKTELLEGVKELLDAGTKELLEDFRSGAGAEEELGFNEEEPGF